jgi:hypothetical protein
MRPVIRTAGGDWERLDPPEVEVLSDGRPRVSWVIDEPDKFADVAFCYPYGPEDVDVLVQETAGALRADIIGVSQQARPLVRVSNDYGTEGGSRSGVYLIARQHSGETPGSWVLDGFLRHVASLGADAPLVWAVPLSNVDGVEQGDYGKDNFPYDLNRAWGSPPMRHETLVFQRDIQRWKTRCRPLLGVDFHGPGGTEADGVYLYLPDPERLPEAHRSALAWSADLKDALTSRYASGDFARLVRYASRWETPGFASYLAQICGICSFTIETPYAMVGDLVLTREYYREIGKLMADAVIRKLK